MTADQKQNFLARRGSMEAQHQLFFSYRRVDLARAQLLLDALERAGISVWVDKNKIDDHAPVSDEIRRAIAASKCLLAFYSDTYPDSVPCQMAVSRLKCNVFEVVVPVCHEVEVGQEDFCWAFPSE